MRQCAYNTDPRPVAGGFVQKKAFSKINLILDVIARRQDGYHEVRSVMQSLELHDTVTIEVLPSSCELSASDEMGESRDITGFRNLYQKRQKVPADCNFILTCSDEALPTDDRNLVTRAAKYMIQEYDITQAVRIHLEKRIPTAAGLAGGSSDCAATISGINELFCLNIPLSTSDESQPSLMSIGKGFGADVPFCLLGGTALAEGIGEKLTPLPIHPPCWVLLVCPNIPVSTKEIFGKYNPAFSSPGNVPDMVQSLAQGNIRQIAANFSNDLTQVTTKLHPEILDIIDFLKVNGALNAAMSGSGPSVFGYFLDEETAYRAASIFESRPKNRPENKLGKVFLTKIS